MYFNNNTIKIIPGKSQIQILLIIISGVLKTDSKSGVHRYEISAL